MQVYAFNKNQNRVFVEAAEQASDYSCLECGQTVRKRGGLHKQLHFYHLHPETSCRLNGKSAEHIAIQRYLKNLLGETCEEEVAFPHIGRIADIVWFSKNLIFEVQCSPITADEVRARIADYEKAGFQVIWILHEAEFCKKRVSASTLWLQNHTHYFAENDFLSTPAIYDFCPVILRQKRLGSFLKRPIDLSQIQKRKRVKTVASLPTYMHKRVELWNYFVSGDLLEAIENNELHIFDEANQFEASFSGNKTQEKSSLTEKLLQPFFRLFKSIYYYLIEQSTR